MLRKLQPTLMLAIVLSLICWAGSPLMAQTTAISGTVTDQTGGIVPGLEVTMVHLATGNQRTTVTDDQGRYSFAQVAPGRYDLRAELVGFKTALIPNVNLLVDSPATVDIQLELGEVTEVVTVAGTRVSVKNTVDSSIGTAMSGEQIVSLPLNQRNVARLLSVQPGVTPDGEVSGSRRDQSNLTLDGIDVNEQQSGQAFTPVLRVTPDSIQEFRVTVSNPTATQGRSSGAQVSLVTRSGTNEFHGSLYHFHRNTRHAANDFFNNRSDIDRPKLLRNLFGGSIGGPISRDRAFFFFNYEGRRDRSEATALREVPLAHLGQGIFRYNNTAGDLVSVGPAEIAALYPETGGVNPAAQAVLGDAAARYPANDDGTGDQLNTGGFRFNAPIPLNENTFTAKMDFNLTGTQQMFVRGNYQWDHQGFISRFPDTPEPSLWSHPAGVAVGHSWSVTPTFINTFRYGLTRQAFSSQGDSADNLISFRFVFQPRTFSRTLSRTTPVHNFTNDTSWIRGNHTVQFGTNIRLIDNNRESFANSFDTAIMNPSFYANSGGVLDVIDDFASGQRDVIRNAATALLGRYTQFSGRFQFDVGGSLMPSGAPTLRTFATDEYELYIEDNWQVARNLTLNLGLRYGVSTPVHETGGFQVAPTTPLGEFFDRRVAGAMAGQAFNDPITLDLAGPFHNRPGFYPTDRNNFSPRVSAAWSPHFDNGFLRTLFGGRGESVFRGGYAAMYDRIGSALAVSFDLGNVLGFVTEQTTPANTFDVSSFLGPNFTGFNQDIRPLLVPAGLTIPESLQFPLSHPSDGGRRIENSLDSALTTPINHSWNFSVGREFQGGLFLEASYLGRAARNLLANRDVMHPNNIVDPASGMDWYTAARQLAEHRLADTPIDQIPNIPFFENLYPEFTFFFGGTPTQNAFGLVARDGFDILDWTFIQDILDRFGDQGHLFFHPQYGALNTLGTMAESDYHAFSFTVRERMRENLTFDVNYTWSKSMDWASGSGLGGGISDSGGVFAEILNPLTPDATRSVSDFDIQHIINSSWLLTLPFGHGQKYLSGSHGAVDAILGGWSLNGVFRWNSGLAQTGPFEASRWATNWNFPSNAVRIRDPRPDPNKGVDGRAPNFFSDPEFAYQSFRDAFAGEVGDRNTYRSPSFVTVDFGLFKSFRMPYSEGHRVTFRWEVFNATNTQRLGRWTGDRSSFATAPDPQIGTPAPTFGNITAIHTFARPREMQFGLRYDF